MLAKILHVWRVKIDFISNTSLHHGTFSRFKSFFTPYRTRDMKIQTFSSRNHQKSRHDGSLVLINTTFAQFPRKNSSCLARQNEFHFFKSLTFGTCSRFKRFLTPYGTRDINIQYFLSRNNQKNQMTRRLPSLIFAR